MDDPIIFDCFANPERDSTWNAGPKTCAGCGIQSAGFEGPFLGDEEDAVECEFLCSECVASGVVGEFDLVFNQPDLEAIQHQLQELHPGIPMEKLARLTEEAFLEIAEFTPPWPLAKQILWPAHCGKGMHYCGHQKGAHTFRCRVCTELMQIESQT